ncbi:cytochrome c oxidase subunit 2A [Paenibacillus montanisoli]|uniref:Cytochrome c oxidase subunit 2A n=1 Tax=Paenibacillus montanisoli TaxID=2081970 RepID=A0A328U1A9_9BACL|nr:cytochrome c oxidase subunit 2A [Paenibacillus montanisoli]RAP76547.1 cytochrome c oxidase subunit 2A [Paenibacillus montanisoli]
MANRTRQEARKDVGENEQLKGTFASVLLIGGFIVVLWIVIFALYLCRQ